MQHESNGTVVQDRTADEPPGSLIARDCLLTRARQISRVLTSVYDDALRPFGIVAPQFSLLVLIAKFGPISRSDLSRRNHHERSTLTRNLQPLIAQGWIAEDVPASDGRSRPLSLTHEGQALLKNAASAWSVAQSHATSFLGEGGAHELIDIARKLPLRML
ncbi:MarR family transcriptional regulator [Paraburkholderia monticola]|uniref:MarR family transcriptional regulator n=1 Tax=Paraburkholderia monticola TaxID=1399968 RepID=A0A149PK31_9BURK|nr:MarR family winged helix-turn-helix transcriptional regulator [Paraburkholderia monticola]KXU85407.1 MarR family transcriptional regulator [Paraburkholderia monticola]